MTTNPLYVPGLAAVRTTPPDIEAQAQSKETTSSEWAASASSDEERQWKYREPASSLTRRLAVYLFVLKGLLAATIAAGINFGIAYGTYHTQAFVRLFVLPNALTADASITLIAEFVITWAVECFVVSFNLRRGEIPAIGFLGEPPKNRLVRWFFILPPTHTDNTKELNYKHRPTIQGFLPWTRLFVANAIRSLVCLALLFPLIFGVTVGLLVAAGTHRDGDWYYPVVWTPQVFKLLFGVIVGGLCTPLFSAYFLARAGWILKEKSGNVGTTQHIEELVSEPEPERAEEDTTTKREEA
ncbi:hypothetical protein F5Y16DRAFT_424086 [Xylariaceae sp. FL0255]|nr:hypothetical protein F5Y16DRAFT_424086 [Xylariaceae sp. FL0255]